MLYEMATGTHPFMRATPVQTLSAVITDEPRPVDELNPLMPAPLCWVIDRCLAKDPRRRYTHTADLPADLRQMRNRLLELPREFSLGSSVAKNLTSRIQVAAAAVAVMIPFAAEIVVPGRGRGPDLAEPLRQDGERAGRDVPVLHRSDHLHDRQNFAWSQTMWRRVRAGRLIVKCTGVLQPSPGMESTRRQSQEPQECPQKARPGRAVGVLPHGRARARRPSAPEADQVVW